MQKLQQILIAKKIKKRFDDSLLFLFSICVTPQLAAKQIETKKSIGFFGQEKMSYFLGG